MMQSDLYFSFFLIALARELPIWKQQEFTNWQDKGKNRSTRTVFGRSLSAAKVYGGNGPEVDGVTIQDYLLLC